MSNALDADLVALIGASGSGKTLLVKEQLRAAPGRRIVLAWSWKEHRDHYAPEFGRLVDGDPAQLAELAIAGDNVVYVPRRDKLVAEQFELFCGLALHVGNRIVLVEEMSHVATSRHAPKRWTEVITGGRSEGLSVKATTQRPQLLDASLLDAATEIYCGRLQRGSSKKIMADALDVAVDQVRGLQPLQFLRWRVGGAAVELVSVQAPGKRRRRGQGVRT